MTLLLLTSAGFIYLCMMRSVWRRIILGRLLLALHQVTQETEDCFQRLYLVYHWVIVWYVILEVIFDCDGRDEKIAENPYHAPDSDKSVTWIHRPCRHAELKILDIVEDLEERVYQASIYTKVSSYIFLNFTLTIVCMLNADYSYCASICHYCTHKVVLEAIFRQSDMLSHPLWY